MAWKGWNPAAAAWAPPAAREPTGAGALSAEALSLGPSERAQRPVPAAVQSPWGRKAPASIYTVPERPPPPPPSASVIKEAPAAQNGHWPRPGTPAASAAAPAPPAWPPPDAASFVQAPSPASSPAINIPDGARGRPARPSPSSSLSRLDELSRQASGPSSFVIPRGASSRGLDVPSEAPLTPVAEFLAAAPAAVRAACCGAE